MAAEIASLLDAFAQVTDPRKPRGVRHPFTSMLALTFLGLLCRQTDFASLQRWAEDHWRLLKKPLGFTRNKPPHATTLSRAMARFSLAQFRDGFARWLAGLPGVAAAITAAVDGKTSKQGHDAAGDPVHMLNVFAHRLGLCLAEFPVTGGKPTEPQALKAGLAELLAHYPFLRLFTADALFTQRPLAQVILDADCDFLFAVKDNQPDLLEAIQASFAGAAARRPDAQTREKKRRRDPYPEALDRRGPGSRLHPRGDRLPGHPVDPAGRHRGSRGGDPRSPRDALLHHQPVGR